MTQRAPFPAAAYDIDGDDDAPPVILIHGLGLHRRCNWGEMKKSLAADFRVISYDLPGHGESRRPDTPPSLAGLAAQLRALMDHIGVERAALIGFSLGGMINRRFALDYPARCSALVILNAPHERGKAEQEAAERRQRENASAGPAANIGETIPRWFTPAFMEKNPATVAEIKAAVLANDAANYAAHRAVLVHGVPELIAPAPPIGCPVLVMTCEHDIGSTPEMAHAMAGEIAGAELRIIPRLKHLGLLEDPDAFLQPVTDFLGRCVG